MTLNLFSGLINVFATNPGRREKEFETWAKTEYKNDWEYAYQTMIQTGVGPKNTYINGKMFPVKGKN